MNKSCGDPCVQRNVPTTSSHASSLAAAGQEAQGQGGMDVECTDQRREKDGVEDTNQAPNLAGNLTSTEAGSQEVHQTTSQITFPDGSRETSLQSSAAVDEMEVDYPRTGEVPGEEGPMFPSHPFKIFPDDEVVLPREPVPTKRRRPENEVAMVTHEAGHEHTLAYMYERAYALNELATPHTNIPQQDGESGGEGGGICSTISDNLKSCSMTFSVINYQMKRNHMLITCYNMHIHSTAHEHQLCARVILYQLIG